MDTYFTGEQIIYLPRDLWRISPDLPLYTSDFPYPRTPLSFQSCLPLRPELLSSRIRSIKPERPRKGFIAKLHMPINNSTCVWGRYCRKLVVGSKLEQPRTQKCTTTAFRTSHSSRPHYGILPQTSSMLSKLGTHRVAASCLPFTHLSDGKPVVTALTLTKTRHHFSSSDMSGLDLVSHLSVARALTQKSLCCHGRVLARNAVYM